jgi:hypothetical protein
MAEAPVLYYFTLLFETIGKDHPLQCTKEGNVESNPKRIPAGEYAVDLHIYPADKDDTPHPNWVITRNEGNMGLFEPNFYRARTGDKFANFISIQLTDGTRGWKLEHRTSKRCTGQGDRLRLLDNIKLTTDMKLLTIGGDIQWYPSGQRAVRPTPTPLHFENWTLEYWLKVEEPGQVTESQNATEPQPPQPPTEAPRTGPTGRARWTHDESGNSLPGYGQYFQQG